jgi:RNA polymerase sigma factor (sigma-70 family)
MCGLGDGQLLKRFNAGGEAAESAFAALVERHGPMVLHACRKILRDEHDAQDAFQATFLILVRKAGSLWVRDSLGPWLHRVACRSSARASQAASRRRFFERRSAEAGRSSSTAVKCEGGWDVLHEEIDRLPERFRAALVLCDLEGRTYEDAAQQLACPVGTVKSRLARARERLRRRLEGRGAASVAAVAREGLAKERLDELAVPAGLASDTLRAALRLAGSAEGSVPASILVLVEQGVQAMIASKVKLAALVVGTVALASVGAVVLANQGAESKPAGPVASPPGTTVQAGETAKVADLERRVHQLEQKLGNTTRERVRRGGLLVPGLVSFGAIPDDARDVKTHIWDVLTVNEFVGHYNLAEVTPKEMVLAICYEFQGEPSREELASFLAILGDEPDRLTTPEEIVRTLLNSASFRSSPLASKILACSRTQRRGKM